MAGAMMAVAACCSGGQNTTPPGVSFVAASSLSNSANGATVVVDKPVGTASGHLLIGIAISDGNPTWTPPSGFTETSDQALGAFGETSYKTAGGAEPSNYTFTASKATQKLSAAIIALSNAQPGVVGTVGASAGSAVAPAITMTDDGMVLAIFASAQDGITWTTPSGWTPVVSDGDASTPSFAIFRKTVAAGDTGTVTSATSFGGSRGMLIGVKKL